jgi:hypothetical protein
VKTKSIALLSHSSYRFLELTDRKMRWQNWEALEVVMRMAMPVLQETSVELH